MKTPGLAPFLDLRTMFKSLVTKWLKATSEAESMEGRWAVRNPRQKHGKTMKNPWFQ